MGADLLTGDSARRSHDSAADSDSDTVHCHRAAGGGGERVRSGKEIHDCDLSSGVHAKEHAGATGESCLVVRATKDHPKPPL